MLVAEEESGFSYDENSHMGPVHWGELRPEWSMCNYGSMQSPIDLLNERVQVVTNLGRLHREYKPCNATLVNRGHDMMVSFSYHRHSIKGNCPVKEKCCSNVELCDDL